MSYAHVSTSMSFTLYSIGHTIVVGPERASRNLQSSELKLKLQSRTLEVPLKEHINN